MKHTIIIATMAFFLLSCGSKPNKPTEKESVDSLGTTLADSTQSVIFIKDKSQYDELFVEGLSGTNDSISLVDNYLITGKDTTFFPEALPLNKAVAFKAKKGDNIYLLTVTRTILSVWHTILSIAKTAERFFTRNRGKQF